MSHSLRLPTNIETSTFFVDESGAKGSGGRHFVLAAVKTHDPDDLSRSVRHLRDQHQFHKNEFHFKDVTKNSLPLYRELVDLLIEKEVTIGASIVDKDVFDPFDGMGLDETWEAHAWSTAALVKGMTSRRELVTVLMDSISTPNGISYGAELQRKINADWKTTRVVSAVSLDSCTCDGLQLADLVASAIAHQRTQLASVSFDEYASNTKNHKAQLSVYLSTQLGAAGFPNGKNGRLNIRTFEGANNPLRVRVKSQQEDLHGASK